MRRQFIPVCVIIFCNFFLNAGAQSVSDSLVIRDLQWTADSHATFVELVIPSAGSKLQGFIYKANGSQKHPTLLLLHGLPGNERNLDIAQVARSEGWNVIYFNYRGAWGSQGEFTFKHCVEDVVNVVDYCKKNQESLQIDTSNIVLFGHSMGAWVCLKAIQLIPSITKGFALSAWNIADEAHDSMRLRMAEKEAETYFVLNKKSGKNLFEPVETNRAYYDLGNDGPALTSKKIIMLDEHHLNEKTAGYIKAANHAFFEYQVWKTDHPFTNKRASLINYVMAFLNRK